MIKKTAVFLILFSLFFIGGKKVYAANEFATSYEAVYDVGEDGVTNVLQKITLRNLTNQYFVSNFTLTIGSTDVFDVSAADDEGNMEVSVDRQTNKTAINVKFNRQVAGLDKLQTINLRFKSKDFASSLGKTWEVNLPKIPSGENIESYKLTLGVPLKFGDPTSIFPKPKSENQSYNRLFFHYDKGQLVDSGLSATFGTVQLFDFNLSYHLENDTLVPLMAKVALPPDTSYQDILLDKISPAPLNVTVDEDGNYLAWYKIGSKTSLDVGIEGLAKLYLKSKNKEVIKLTSDDYNQWTKVDRYWESDSLVVRNILKEILPQETPLTTRETARKIYRYTVDTLSYNSQRLNDNGIERLGAVTALSNPGQAVCMEFTDLFIALSRAANIPSREVDGYAYSQNKSLRPASLSKELLHAWPEYYDETRGWIMVDPTWENTSGGVDYFNKFDLNHLSLAIKGISSTAPFVSDDVKVNLSEKDFSPQPQLIVTSDIKEHLWAGLPNTFTVKLENRGKTYLNPSKLMVSSQNLLIEGQDQASLGNNYTNIPLIPPQGYVEETFKVKSRTLLDNNTEELTLSINDHQVKYTVKVTPVFLIKPYPYIIIGLIAFSSLTYLTLLGLHIYRYKTSQSTTKNEPQRT